MSFTIEPSLDLVGAGSYQFGTSRGVEVGAPKRQEGAHLSATPNTRPNSGMWFGGGLTTEADGVDDRREVGLRLLGIERGAN
ncbi:MAG: hypothetical protein CL483_04575 [Acidobacteria bacterium]|nr:hypothetical protein [Acidobacteriota bacterium]